MRTLTLNYFDRSDCMLIQEASATVLGEMQGSPAAGPVPAVAAEAKEEPPAIPLFFQGGAVQWQKLIV